MKIILVLAISLFAATGCTTAQMRAQQEENQIVAEFQQKWQEPRFDVIRKKVSAFELITPTRYTLINDKVIEEEKEMLLDYIDLIDEYTKTYSDFAMKNVPWALPALAKVRERRLISFSELYNGRISYGEYNKLSSQSRAMYLEDWLKAQQEFTKLSLAAQRNQLQANANFIQAAQQLAPPPPKLKNNVTYTNCQWFGQSMDCTSY